MFEWIKALNSKLDQFLYNKAPRSVAATDRFTLEQEEEPALNPIPKVVFLSWIGFMTFLVGVILFCLVSF